MLKRQRSYVRDHPRLRGENRQTKRTLAWDVGSPPLARGKPPITYPQPMTLRITPACAGKTFALDPPLASTPDHPRLRGENCCHLLLLASVPGSPPLARGKRITFKNLKDGRRITPACAGKTSVFACVRYLEKDHPRLRGENTKRSLYLRHFQNAPHHISLSF